MLQSKLPHVGTTIFTVMSALAAEHGATNLGQGFPDFQPPGELTAALSRAALAGHNQYAPMAGVASLRQAIAAKIGELYAPAAATSADEQVTVTSGATEALFNAIACSVRSGDEVVLLDPCYDSYEPAVLLAGGRPVHVPLTGQRFEVDWARVAAAVTPATRLLVVNSPHNPCGTVLSDSDMQQLARLLDRHRQLLVLSDEVYEHMAFDGRPHRSVLCYPDIAARSFAVFSFGKTYHCTGWKLGYCVAPAELSREFRKVHQFNTFSSFTPVQHAVAHMMTAHPEHHRRLAHFYQQKRDRFQQQLARRTLFTPLPVHGGFFQLVDYSRVSDLPDMDFARWLTVEHGVTAIPLSPFYAQPPADQRLVRLCYAKEDSTLETALQKLEKVPAKSN